MLILRYSLAAKLIYFAQTIDPSIVAPFAQQFDEIMRNTYLKIIDLENINTAFVQSRSPRGTDARARVASGRGIPFRVPG